MSIYPYSTVSQLVATSWPQRLKSARTEAEVVDVARDFLATFSPYDLARLPEPLRPGRLVDGNDVSEYAFALVRHDHDDGHGTARCIHRLTTFFTNASVRLTELNGRPARPNVAGAVPRDYLAPGRPTPR